MNVDLHSSIFILILKDDLKNKVDKEEFTF